MFSIVCVLIASLNIEIARFEIPVYLSMILGANFSSESGPEILLNRSLLLKFGGHVTTKKGATWLFATEKGSHLWPVGTHPCSNGVAQTVPEALPPLPVQSFSPVLLPVQRLPLPATAFPTPGAGCCFPATPSQGRARWVGKPGAGALVLALTGVADLSSRTGGSYPLLGADTACASAAAETSAGTPCRSACCSR